MLGFNPLILAATKLHFYFGSLIGFAAGSQSSPDSVNAALYDFRRLCEDLGAATTSSAEIDIESYRYSEWFEDRLQLGCNNGELL